MKSSTNHNTLQMEITQAFINRWVSKLWCIHSMEYLATLRNEARIHDTTWISLENIIHNQRSQAHKRTHTVCIKHPELVKNIFFGRNVLTHMERHYTLDFELLPQMMWPSCEVVIGSSKEGEVAGRKIRGWLTVGDTKVYRNSSVWHWTSILPKQAVSLYKPSLTLVLVAS